MKISLPEIWTLLLMAGTSGFAIFVAEFFFIPAGISQTTSGSGNLFLIFIFLGLTILFTGVILLVARRRGLRSIRIIFIILTLYVIFWISLPIADIFVSIQPIPLTVAIYEVYGIWFLIPAVMGYLLIFKNEWYVTDTAGFMLSAGLAAAWGLELQAWYSVILLVAFALYDYISVYKTKHMVTLARTAFSSDLPMLFVIPSSTGFKMKDIDMDHREEGKPDAVLLGFGDIAMPSILVVSSTVSYGFALPFFLLPIFGAMIGLVTLFLTARRPAPGLPYINSGAIVGFLMAYLLFSAHL